jgi:hypothetical protein
MRVYLNDRRDPEDCATPQELCGTGSFFAGAGNQAKVAISKSPLARDASRSCGTTLQGLACKSSEPNELNL